MKRKNLSWLIFVAYFGLFVVLAIIFYYFYLDKLLLPGAEPPEVILVNQGKIYYTSSAGFLSVNPEYIKTGALIDATNLLQSGAVVSSFDLTTNKLAYAATASNDSSEVWLIDQDTSETTPIGPTTPDKTYLNFTKPKFSPSGNFLAYLATSSSNDAIYLYNYQDGQTVSLSNAPNAKISDYSWDKTGENIIFCTSNQTPNYCQANETDSGKKVGSFLAEVSQIEWRHSETLFYLAEKDGAANIYRLSELAGVPEPETTIASPKTVKSFSLSDDGSSVAFEVINGQGSDIYTAKTDGSNLIQLSSDAESQNPQISPNGRQVAYFKPNDGIYLIDTDKTNKEKLLSLVGQNIKLLGWR